MFCGSGVFKFKKLLIKAQKIKSVMGLGRNNKFKEGE
jgi:hypothetical protein